MTIARAEAVRLANRTNELNQDLAHNQSQMIDLLRGSKAAELLDLNGIGPVTAGVVYSA